MEESSGVAVFKNCRRKAADVKETPSAARLNEAIIELGILPRLSAKILLRFQCASRRWHNLISKNMQDPYFLHLHCLSAPSGLFQVESESRYERRASFASRDCRSIGIPCSTCGIETMLSGRRALASCNGLVCILSYRWDAQKLCIGNPCLRDWRILPLHRAIFGATLHGLAVDVGKLSAVTTYKLVIATDSPYQATSYVPVEFLEYKFEVLSSTTGQWGKPKGKIVLPYRTKPSNFSSAYVRGVLYWECKPYLLWFDPNDERSGLHDLPPAGAGREQLMGKVGEWNGHLSYSWKTRNDKIEIWSTDLLCSSWTKRHSVDVLKIVQGNIQVLAPFFPMYPLLLNWKKDGHIRLVTTTPYIDGEVIFLCINSILFCYDIETGNVQKVGTYCVYSRWIPYKNCLLPLPKL